MEPISAISTTLSGIKTAIDIAKIIKTSGDSLEKSELKLKIVELIDALVETKSQIIGLKENDVQKDEIIKELNKRLENIDNLEFRKYYYYEKNTGDGPFCQKCFESKGSVIHLIPLTGGRWQCNNCDVKVLDDEYYAKEKAAFEEMSHRRKDDYDSLTGY